MHASSLQINLTLTNLFHLLQIVIVLSEAWEVKFSFVVS